MLSGFDRRQRGFGFCAFATIGLSACDGSSAHMFGYKSDAHATVLRYVLPPGQTLAMNDQSLRRFETQYREIYARSLGQGVDVNARVLNLSDKKIMYAAFHLNGALGSAALMLPQGNE